MVNYIIFYFKLINYFSPNIWPEYWELQGSRVTNPEKLFNFLNNTFYTE